MTAILPPAVEVAYTRNHQMAPPDPSSCSRSQNQRPGRSSKGLGDRPAPLHPPHHPREKIERGPGSGGCWGHAVSFNSVLSKARQPSGAGSTFCGDFRLNPLCGSALGPHTLTRTSRTCERRVTP